MRRSSLIVSLVLVVPAGFYLKLYRGPGADWLNNSFDGAMYEIFWCLLFALVFPLARPRVIAWWVLVATCGLEFLQLWHPPFLEAMRSHFLGAAILGTTFDRGDFPYYFLGSGVGWFWMERTKVARG